MNRGSRHQDTFIDDTDRRSFLQLLGHSSTQQGLEILAYCLMSNHFHLVTHGTNHALSAAMRHLSSVYTRRFNERHGFDGSLFRGRFCSVDITTDEQLLATVDYVHKNPAEIGEDPRTYAWSSLAAYEGNSGRPRWLDTQLYKGIWADPPPIQVGSDPLDLRAVEACVQSVFAAGPETLHDTSRGRRNEPRLALVLLWIDRVGALPSSLVSSYGFRSDNTVRSALRRARLLASSDEAFKTAIQQAQRQLFG